MKQYTAARLEAVLSVEEFLRTAVDVPKFLACCQSCGHYRKSWCCPDFDFDPMTVWRRYKTLHLFAWVLTPNAGCGGEDLFRALEAEKPVTARFLAELERNTPGSLALVCGRCDLCPVCAREEGLPCRHPAALRYSIEALGGDVGEICSRYFGKPLQWGVNPEYVLLVGGLLTNE